MSRLRGSLVALVICLGCGPAAEQRAKAPGGPRFPLPGSTPPAVRLPAFDTNQPALVLDRERGHVVVLSYWASWCGPCAEEMPELSVLAARYHDQGLRVYAIVHDDDPATAAKWMRAHNVALPLVVDPGKHAWTAYLARGLPTAFVIGRDGKLWHRQEGYEGPGYWEPRLQAALAGRPPA